MDKISSRLLPPVIIGHRGFRSNYPENTLTSFKAAMAAGADMIELDVHLTKDRQLAVIHDEKVDRTTNGKGRVCDFTLDELKQLDAGKWFHPSFSGEPIPCLEEVLNLARDKIYVNIELKADPERPDVALELGSCVLEVVRKEKAKDFVVASSFQLELLASLRRESADLAIGVLTYKKKQGFLEVCEAIRAIAWHPHYQYFSKQELAAAKSMGLKILPFTVNDKKEMKRLLEMGVDGFFTDDPEAGKRVIRQVMGKR